MTGSFSAGPTAAEVRACYQLFLGRPPESAEVVAHVMSRPQAELLPRVLKCDEFQNGVVRVLIHGGELPHARRSPCPDPADIDWLGGIAALDAEALEGLGRATSWKSFFLRLFADPSFHPLAAPFIVGLDGLAGASTDRRCESAETASALIRAGIDHAVKLGAYHVLLSGWIYDDHAPVTRSEIRFGQARLDCSEHLRRTARGDVAQLFGVPDGLPAQYGFILVAALPAGVSMGADIELMLSAGEASLSLKADVAAEMDVPALIGGLERRYDGETRLVVFEEMLAGQYLSRLPVLDRQIVTAAWRGASTFCGGSFRDERSQEELRLERVLALAGIGLVITGWSSIDAAALDRVELVTPGAPSCCVSNEWARIANPEIYRQLRDAGATLSHDEIGFLSFMPIEEETSAAYLIIRLTDGRSRRISLQPEAVPRDPIDAAKSVLSLFESNERRLRFVLDRHIGPAILALWKHRPPAPMPETLIYGTPSRAPDISLIVPIYGRYDFIELQIAQFANDTYLSDQQLIYVIDDPSIADLVRTQAADLFALYRVPFTLLFSGQNRGFAGATNLGAAQARGRKLLLLNSDVFPQSPGWLEQLVMASDTLPQAGAVAPKLLFEDGSVQHRGIGYLRYPAWTDFWICDHAGKGLPDLEPTSDAVAMPAVTAACLLIDRALYEELGGLDETYIIGDFEDSDLCLKIGAKGLRSYVVPSVTLYHLERHSQRSASLRDWREKLTLYNCWLHDRRWNETLNELAGRIP